MGRGGGVRIRSELVIFKPFVETLISVRVRPGRHHSNASHVPLCQLRAARPKTPMVVFWRWHGWLFPCPDPSKNKRIAHAQGLELSLLLFLKWRMKIDITNTQESTVWNKIFCKQCCCCYNCAWNWGKQGGDHRGLPGFVFFRGFFSVLIKTHIKLDLDTEWNDDATQDRCNRCWIFCILPVLGQSSASVAKLRDLDLIRDLNLLSQTKKRKQISANSPHSSEIFVFSTVVAAHGWFF